LRALEMYRSYFAHASFYPPNSFLHTPMTDAASAKPALAASLRNMADAGVIVDEGEPVARKRAGEAR
jgi:hypothetical protein